MSRRKQPAPCKVQDLLTPVSTTNEQEDQAVKLNGGSFDQRSCKNQARYNSGLSRLDRDGKENQTNHDARIASSYDEPLNLSTFEDLKTSNFLLNGDVDEKMQESLGRSPSAEEELACPICHKTFMSKYGLLTHAEVHSTPELKCSDCNLSFTSRSAFVTHQLTHNRKEANSVRDAPSENSVVFQKIKQISGFSDLSFIDFSSNKFSAISEDLCSRALHRLTVRDCKYFFLCKSCDRLFPTLFSLNYHIKKQHFVTNRQSEDEVCPTSNTLAKTKVQKNEALQEIAQSLGLGSVSVPSAVKDPVTSSSILLDYSMESKNFRTSPSFALLKVPKWMRSSDRCFYDSEMTRERAPLKLKLVRRRTTEDEEDSLLVPNKYFIEDEIEEVREESGSERADKDKELKEKSKKVSCETCGEFFASNTALSGHKAASICGIGVGPSSNGRKMFWCRLCNYASCEKSTILRHQRTHTGLRPYSCKFCDIAFTTKANCERHIRKRHRVRVSNDVDVKNAVYCDYDLLRKARDGEINIPSSATVSNPGGKFFSFICRICKAAFSSRNSGARHVMSKHAIMNRKRASECINCVRVPNKKSTEDHSHPEGRSSMIGNKPKTENQPLHYAPANNPGKMAVKTIKLIPLGKIRSHHENAMRMAEHYQLEYDKVFQSMKDMRDGSHRLSAKLLSLIGSASAILDSPPPSSSVMPSRDQLEDDSENVEDGEEQSKNLSSFFGSGDLDSYDAYKANEKDDILSATSPPESPFKPWKSTSSSLLLRHFAASSRKQMSGMDESEDTSTSRGVSTKEEGNLSSVGQIVSFLKAPPLLAVSNEQDSSPSDNFSHVIKSRDSTNFSSLATKPQLGVSGRDRTRMSWSNLPVIPRLRDERGRYIRDPNSPYPKQPKMKPSSSSYSSNHHDLPTMVPMQVGKRRLNMSQRKEYLLNSDLQMKGRKCPKCDKVFPWASSLSRHIMTHTGLKPFMCARCSMRFTTRSNLLRHAYRRHGLERGSTQRHDVLVALSLSEQKEHAEKEAQKMAEMEEEQRGMDVVEPAEDEVQETNDESDRSVLENEQMTEIKLGSKPVDRGMSHYNKRYLCGICRLPFANRSNLVRHLHRLHRITKDDPEFRSLLIKILPSLKVKFNRSFPALLPRKSSLDGAVAEDLDVSPQTASPSSVLVNGASNGDLDLGAAKIKPFTCGICSIGFTKRNNAARHIQHQHNVSRKSAHFHQLIIRNEQEGVVQKDEVEPPASLAAFAENLQASASSRSSQTENGNCERDADMVEQNKKLSVVKVEAAVEPGNDDDAWKKNDDLSTVEFSKKPPESRPMKKKDIRLTHFICGVCKRIFKEVSALKDHLDEHNIPHPWHCTICGVPFTNKYNCQRHLMRRHGVADVEPKYVEDLRHGPRYPRKKSKGLGRARTSHK